MTSETVLQDVSEPQRQPQERRELVGVDRDQDGTQYGGEGADDNGGVHHLVLAVDQLREKQPKDQRELEDRRHHHQRRNRKRGVDEGLGDGDQHGRGEELGDVFALHALDVGPGAGLEQDQREEQRRRGIGEAAPRQPC